MRCPDHDAWRSGLDSTRMLHVRCSGCVLRLYKVASSSIGCPSVTCCQAFSRKSLASRRAYSGKCRSMTSAIVRRLCTALQPWISERRLYYLHQTGSNGVVRNIQSFCRKRQADYIVKTMWIWTWIHEFVFTAASPTAPPRFSDIRQVATLSSAASRR